MLQSCIPSAEFVWLCTAFFAAGALPGVRAGLFGIGGGTVVVRSLYEVFGLFGALMMCGCRCASVRRSP